MIRTKYTARGRQIQNVRRESFPKRIEGSSQYAYGLNLGVSLGQSFGDKLYAVPINGCKDYVVVI